MAAERRFVLLLGLEIGDAEGYARYRAEMRPLLEAFGGRFDCDFRVAEVLSAPGAARIDRVFALSFPDRTARERFFADPDYRRVRARWFEPSVRATAVLGEFEEAASGERG